MEETLNFEKLIPFIKKALDNQGIKPEEIHQELQAQEAGKTHDQDLDDVDSNILDNGEHNRSDMTNSEGKALETSFKEFDVEVAIDKIKERKSYTEDGGVTKESSELTYWDLLTKYDNHSRQTAP